MNHTEETLSVVGLGKLGLCMAGCLAEVGYPVIGIDVNPSLITSINNGEVPYVETDLDRVLKNARGKLRATLDYADAIQNSDTTFIVVATPTQSDGTYGNEQLEASLIAIAEQLKTKSKKHRIVVSCTVMPGTLNNSMVPLVERVSGKKLGIGFSLAYNPEFIAMGDVIRIFTHPDFVLVGESEPEIGQKLEEIYKVLCPNDPPISRMSLINAELAKISLNCYVTTKITYANMLAELCEKLPGGDVDVITKAIGQDLRIGGKVLRGGLGFGGPCFPRDNRAFVRLAADFGMNANLAKTTHETNRWQEQRIVEWIRSDLPVGSTIAILGAAYKPRTPLVEESQAMNLARLLAQIGYVIRLQDPLAIANAKLELGASVEYYEQIEAALQNADAAIVTILGEEYGRITAETFLNAMNKNGIVYDLWRQYRGQNFGSLRYRAVGLG
ncbi:MAG: nucleotide sugar dehydrogenase [bacterium]|nr:nucleotide sugar dehydrogenase [bacterium]